MQYTYRNHQMFMKAMENMDDTDVHNARQAKDKPMHFRQDLASAADIEALVSHHKARTQRKGRA